jgi:hypothetical protein
VTYPRSGQQLIARSIVAYFDGGYEENYCEYYTCCKSFPCAVKQDVLLHKNHDFSLSFDKDQEMRYAVGIRHPYDSILSFYKIYGRGRNINTFLRRKAKHWNGFVKKWVLNSDATIFEYKHVVANFETELVRAIEHFWPGHAIDTDRIAWIKQNLLTGPAHHRDRSPMNTKGVTRKNHREDYPYHGEELYDRLIKITGGLIEEVEEVIGFKL